MSIGRLIGVMIAVVLVILFVRVLRDPHRTSLPLASSDLSALQGPLRRLAPEERALVEAYVQRSHGDVLPPKFADPDNPFTARTFGEAIVLQKRWQDKAQAQHSAASERASEHDRLLAPLREIVVAAVARREILSVDELDARQNVQFAATTRGAVKRAQINDNRPVLVVTVDLANLGQSDIVELKGALQARDRNGLLPMDLCWIDLDQRLTIPVGGHVEVACANLNRVPDANDRAFVDDASGRFTLSWEPKHLRTRSGKVLDSD